MQLQICLLNTPALRDPEARKEWEAATARDLGLDEAVAEGLISRYFFLWNRWNGQLITVRLVPHPKHRRTPGIQRLKELFFRGPL